MQHREPPPEREPPSDRDPPLDDELASAETLTLAQLHTHDPFFYTPLEERFERITRLACRALDVPVAAITVVHDDRQWFKSVTNWEVNELPLEKSLCAEVVKTGRQIIAQDTHDDLYLMSNPFVCNGPKFRFYAGFPLKDADGNTMGTFCVMDTKPSQTDEQFVAAFADLGDMAHHEIVSTDMHSAHVELVAKLGDSRRAAMFDVLTRLWNRRGGMHLLNKAVGEALKHDQTLGVCLADIDDFKSVNDQYGHPVGDEVLRKVSNRIVSAVRPEDVVCRFGGEEFMVLVRDVDDRACFTIANRICETVREEPIRTRKAVLPITLSVGIAMRDFGDDVTAEQLLRRADDGLYKSKHQGKDRITFAAAAER